MSFKIKVILFLFLIMMPVSLGILAANENSQTYVSFYGTDPETLDYLYTFKHTDSKHFANFIDGLLEHDSYGNLVGALAIDWWADLDLRVWTFKLREGVHWYTDEGVEYGRVTAHDFVAGLRYAANVNSQTLYLVHDLIENLNLYLEGEVHFDEVGVTAIDDYTLEYRLSSPTPYFPTLTTYSILLPVHQGFLESKGSGCKLDQPNTAQCGFGSLSANSILYNGAYFLKNFTSKSVIEYEANPHYWDQDNVHVKAVKLIYAGAAAPTSLFLAFDRGEIVAAPIDVHNPSIVAVARKKYGDSIFVTDTNAALIFATFNFNRTLYHSPLNPRVDRSLKSEKQRQDTKLAILNTSFRQGLLRAIDTVAINSQTVGEELKYVSLRNMLTQPTFVYTSQNQAYGELVTSALKRLDPEVYPPEFSADDGQAAYYNPELAKALMMQAKSELKESGVDFPVYLDVLVNGENERNFRTAQALKQSVEEHLSGLVQINLTLSARHHFLAAKTADLINTDLYFYTAWSPDYGDPKSYLDILDPRSGDMLKSFGLNRQAEESSEEAKIKEGIGLQTFKRLKDVADQEVKDLDLRYALYAEAEAYMIHQAYLIPLYASGGSYAVSRVIPYTKSYSPYGLSEMKFKRMQLSSEIITVRERNQYYKKWLNEMRRSKI